MTKNWINVGVAKKSKTERSVIVFLPWGKLRMSLKQLQRVIDGKAPMVNIGCWRNEISEDELERLNASYITAKAAVEHDERRKLEEEHYNNFLPSLTEQEKKVLHFH
jgi:DNA anti-recombination protein RmuC